MINESAQWVLIIIALAFALFRDNVHYYPEHQRGVDWRKLDLMWDKLFPLKFEVIEIGYKNSRAGYRVKQSRPGTDYQVKYSQIFLTREEAEAHLKLPLSGRLYWSCDPEGEDD